MAPPDDLPYRVPNFGSPSFVMFLGAIFFAPLLLIAIFAVAPTMSAGYVLFFGATFLCGIEFWTALTAVPIRIHFVESGLILRFLVGRRIVNWPEVLLVRRLAFLDAYNGKVCRTLWYYEMVSSDSMFEFMTQEHDRSWDCVRCECQRAWIIDQMCEIEIEYTPTVEWNDEERQRFVAFLRRELQRRQRRKALWKLLALGLAGMLAWDLFHPALAGDRSGPAILGLALILAGLYRDRFRPDVDRLAIDGLGRRVTAPREFRRVGWPTGMIPATEAGTAKLKS